MASRLNLDQPQRRTHGNHSKKRRTTVKTPAERLAYSIQEAADILGVNYFSIYRLIQRGKLKACRALRGTLLVSRSELLKLLETQ
jgi:excisionase family DNA binding protein